ncbi:high affinity immunoglobulin epsilon receptor subunit gamma isoform X1 [Python bivittatus]|uniref:high affinity immunoglobulin epsilon receptor subunit gamma isoform X1 n=1 Tax=Python bivittatus TaxID=176946 RepID=UPI000441C2F5|nr:high affinity immunoglobulin epsilon receptor subunit gamma isoform X1 [Python bivittatus]
MKFLGVALRVLLVAGVAEALEEPQLCYILDGILFLYGIALTFLYCRLKFQHRKKADSAAAASPIYEKVEGVYTGLDVQQMQTYTPLGASKQPLQDPPPRKTSSTE